MTLNKTEINHEKNLLLLLIAMAVLLSLTSLAACGECTHTYKDGVCASCGEADPNYKPPCAHSYEDGNCTLCGDPCEHSYTEGVCTVCGTEDPDYIPADGGRSLYGEGVHCSRC